MGDFATLEQLQNSPPGSQSALGRTVLRERRTGEAPTLGGHFTGRRHPTAFDWRRRLVELEAEIREQDARLAWLLG